LPPLPPSKSIFANASTNIISPKDIVNINEHKHASDAVPGYKPPMTPTYGVVDDFTF
jgi:hypothetical protein